MSDFNFQLVKNRQSELLREAQNQTLTSSRARRETLVSVRLTFELRLGGRQRQVPSES
jgi:hypothetical protein